MTSELQNPWVTPDANAKQALVGLLIPMAEMLWKMELDGSLVEQLQPGAETDPSTKGGAVRHVIGRRAKDPEFRLEGLGAMMQLIWAISQAPTDFPLLQRIDDFGPISDEVAREFQGDLWVVLWNYAFLIDRYCHENGRNAGYFLDRAADMLEHELGHATATGECPICHHEPDTLH